MNTKQQRDILDKLSVIINQTNYLRVICLGDPATAAQAAALQQKQDQLSEEFDVLLKKILSNWLGSAAVVKGQLTKANGNLEDSIQDIKDNIDTANNIVKAVGYIDQAIKIAAALI